jgi:anti-anti-sigma factor
MVIEVDEGCETYDFLQTPAISTGKWANDFLSVPTFPVWMEVGNERPPMYRMEPEVTIASVETLRDYAIVTIGERMDIFNAPSLMAQLNQLVADGAMHFIVDLTAVRVVDADGDYPLLHLLKCAQEVGGSVLLVCPVGNPIRVFYEMMRLDTLFEITETLEDALVNLELSPERV